MDQQMFTIIELITEIKCYLLLQFFFPKNLSWTKDRFWFSRFGVTWESAFLGKLSEAAVAVCDQALRTTSSRWLGSRHKVLTD
jgi:hypothetical protein